MPSRVRFVDLERLHAPIRGELDRAFARVVESGRFVLGPEVGAFERALAAACDVPHVLGTSCGTDAILLALMSLGIGPGDEVITPAFSFIAGAEMIARLGATPIFADVDDALLLDPSSARAHVGPRTRAILAVDLFGRRADIAALAALGVPIVEDAAQAIGVPGIGHGVSSAALSFFPTKNLGALGDGGALLTCDPAVDGAARTLHAHGMEKQKYVHQRIGGNMRLDAMQAAFLAAKLPHLPRWTDARRAIARAYGEAFAALPFIVPPVDVSGHVWHQYVLRVKGSARDALRAHLADRGVETEIYYPLALHLQPCFAHLGGTPGALPHAEAASAEVLALPVHPSLSGAELDQVIDAVRSFRA